MVSFLTCEDEHSVTSFSPAGKCTDIETSHSRDRDTVLQDKVTSLVNSLGASMSSATAAAPDPRNDNSEGQVPSFSQLDRRLAGSSQCPYPILKICICAYHRPARIAKPPFALHAGSNQAEQRNGN